MTDHLTPPNPPDAAHADTGAKDDTVSPPTSRAYEATPEARPPSDGLSIRASGKALRTIGKWIVPLLTVVGGSLGGYGGHHVADGKSEAEVAALKSAFEQHLVQSQADKVESTQQTRHLEEALNAARLDYSTQLAGVHQSIQDMDKQLGRVADALEQRSAVGQPVLTRYRQPRRPPLDHQRVERADDSNP